MTKTRTLGSLLHALQKSIANQSLTSEVLQKTIRELVDLGYSQYDTEKFPPLSDTADFDPDVGDSPQNLAEALLWKLGKWKAYKTFVQNYNNRELDVNANGGVVFSAFAKHLQNNENPIYDQHAIRALWAICEFSTNEERRCKSLLFDGNQNWRATGSGDDGSCYRLFVQRITILCEQNRLSSKELDGLLMPLGQAIKKHTKGQKNSPVQKMNDYQRFRALCWPDVE